MKASVSMSEGWGDPQAAADARPSPPDPTRTNFAVSRWLAGRADYAAVLLVVSLSAAVHTVNLFGFPYYHTDEGTYVAQAWAILRLGELAHYTSWYDHAPLGWIQVAAWTVVTQGFHTFGTPIDSGRVLMVLFHCWSTFLVFQIARTISRSTLTATLAALLFGLSAYGVYYHRRVLLDNLTTPWMLLAILMILRSPLALSRVWLSAIALGASVLSKELTVFLVPVLGAVIWVRADRTQRLFATLSWLFVVMAIVSTYPLMALLKGELFPAGSLLGGSGEHVSLIESRRFQASRGKDAGLLSLGSSFWRETIAWAESEPLLAIGGSLGAIGGTLLIRRFPLYGAISLSTLALYAFLARGGIILGFYYVPLLPLLALNVALPLGWLIQWAPGLVARHLGAGGRHRVLAWSTRAVSWSLALLCLLPLARGYQSGALGLERDSFGLWTISQTTGQRQAVDWIRQYVHPDSALLVDDEVWVALREPGQGQPAFPNAHWYFKIDGDPEIRDGVFKGDPRNIDYILNTQDVYDRSREPDVPLAQAAIDASTPVATFDTGRYPLEVRRVHRLNRWRASQDPMLLRSWAQFKGAFVQRGRVVDPAAGGVTTSEAQALAMLRSVYMDDRVAFDQIWAWARARLQVRGDGLLVSRYGADEVLDKSTATAADQDAALALLFAARQWRQPVYQQHAQEILDGIWRHETAVVADTRVVVAGDWARSNNGEAIVSPGALAPYAYRIFSLADPRQPWATLVDSSYRLVTQVQMNPRLGSNAGAVPDLVALDLKTGASRLAGRIGPHADELSADAGRLAARFAVDLVWSGEHRAQEVLDRLSLPRREIATHGWLATAYDLEGRPTIEAESVAMYAGVLPSLLFQGNDDLAHLIFADKILRPTYGTTPEAGSVPSSLDDLGWAWFATAFMHGGLANLWEGETIVNWPVVLAGIDTVPTPDRPGLPPGAVNAALAAGSARSAIVATAEHLTRPASETALASSGSGGPAAGPSRQTIVSAPGARPVPRVAPGPPSAQVARSHGPAAPPAVAPAPAPTLASAPVPAQARAAAPLAESLRHSDPPVPPPAVATTQRPARAAIVPIFRPTPPQATLATYEVQTGDSLLDIADRHGIDVETLLTLNPVADPDLIVAGTSLRVPPVSAGNGSESLEDHP